MPLLGCAAPPTLHAFGDSITVGQGTSLPRHTYVARLATMLGMPASNHAVSGSRIMGHLEQIRTSPVPPAHVAVFLAGYNDVRAGTPLAEYRTLRRGLRGACGKRCAGLCR